MSEDQRRWPRRSLDVTVNFAFNAIAHAKDISFGGICLITDRELPVGKMFQLRFTFPGDDDAMELHGKAVWSRSAGDHIYENGINFWKVDAEAEKRLITYLREPHP